MKRVLACALLVGVVACERRAAPEPASQAMHAGMIRREYMDTTRRTWDGTRARPLTTLIWYPATGTPSETLYVGAPGAAMFNGGVVVPRGANAPGGRRALVLLSHGTGGSAIQMAWLGTELARQGFVAAAVNHHGNTSAEPPLDPRGFFLWWERAIDLRVVLDMILRDSVVGRWVDPSRISAVGFSLGGYTVLSTLGAVTDRERFEAFCRSSQRDFTCEPQAEFPQAPEAFARLLAGGDSAVRASLRRSTASHRDPRIRAAAVLAPAVIQALRPETITTINVPLLVVAGTADRVAPSPTNAHVIRELRPETTLLELPDVGHYLFLNPCTPRGMSILPKLCADAPTVDRAALQSMVARRVAEFLRR